MSLSICPDRKLLKKFGVELVAPLGGRLNQHWLVASKGQRFVLRRWAHQWAASIEYELRLLERVAELGWPVACAASDPIGWEGAIWSMALFLPGEPPSLENPAAEQRARGRLLAQFHYDLAGIHDFGQRGAWRRCEQILADPTIDHTLSEHEKQYPEEIRVLRWHLERARTRIAPIAPHNRAGVVIHGDFTPWNLRFVDGQLSGILDFELAHLDHRIGDFALSWRGKYDEVVHGYNEVAPLSPAEWELLTPMWWSFLIEGVCQDLLSGRGVDEWSIQKLLQRSPLMEADATEFR